MRIGCLGDIPFVVSSDAVLTPTNFTESASATYATHQRHLDNAITEFIGNNPDTITFDMEISAWLGVDPQGEINKLWDYIRNAKPISLVVGNIVYGKYRWVVKSFKTKTKHTSKDGTWMAVTVSVSLLEYIR